MAKQKLKDLQSVLRNKGFKKHGPTDRMDGLSISSYRQQSKGKVGFDVQLWSDGSHRISRIEPSGSMKTKPIDFKSARELPHALKRAELTKPKAEVNVKLGKGASIGDYTRAEKRAQAKLEKRNTPERKELANTIRSQRRAASWAKAIKGWDAEQRNSKFPTDVFGGMPEEADYQDQKLSPKQLKKRIAEDTANYKKDIKKTLQGGGGGGGGKGQKRQPKGQSNGGQFAPK